MLHAHKPETEQSLVEIIFEALRDAKATVKTRANDNVSRFVLMGGDPAKYIKKLYYFLTMHNGHIKFDIQDQNDAVAFELAWITTPSKSSNYNLANHISVVLAEPAIQEAITYSAKQFDNPVFEVRLKHTHCNTHIVRVIKKLIH